METKMKKWEKPQLIILARGTPQENVLTHCKVQGIPQAGPDVNDQGCGWLGNSCAACLARDKNAS